MLRTRNLLHRRLWLGVRVLAATALLLGGTSLLYFAQSVAAQREVKINTFPGMPLEITGVRNLEKGEDWFRDLEIEVKNVSAQPIYGISMAIIFPDIPASAPAPRPDGRMPTRVVTGFPLRFGDPRLLDLKSLAAPGDPSIKPGEVYVFKIPVERVKGLDDMKAKRNFSSDAIKRIELQPDVISFGDGTGFRGPRKKDYRTPKKSARAGGDAGDKSGGPTAGWPLGDTVPQRPYKLGSAPDATIFKKITWSARTPKPARQIQECTGGCEKYIIRYGSEENGSAFCTPPNYPADPVCFRDEAVIDSAEEDCSKYMSMEFSCAGQPCSNDQIDWSASSSCAQFQPCHDFDNDGHDDKACGGDDCDDGNVNAFPLNLEDCTDPANNDCDSNIADEDDPECRTCSYEGPLWETGGGVDCRTLCGNGEDDDCDGLVDLYDGDCGMCFGSPVLVDVTGNGFSLTNLANGVAFDIDGADGGQKEQLSWTSAGSDDAWLALDRNGNGLIDSGQELFGNFTPQPVPPQAVTRNGFLALAEFDRPAHGGNGDGAIDRRDSVFTRLRLWRDANHDGISQAAELYAFPALDVVRLHLDYKESKRVDEFGNQFRYRAKVDDAKGAKVNRWAWDVYLLFSR